MNLFEKASVLNAGFFYFWIQCFLKIGPQHPSASHPDLGVAHFKVGALAARPLSQRGFTIIEVMAAMTMISVSSVGLLWSVNAVKHNSSRIGLVNSVTTLESAVAGAIMDKTNYGGTVAAALRDGGTPQISLAINPQADMSKAPVASTIRSGEITSYSPALETCANYGTSECPIRIKVELRRVTVGTRAHYAFAYRIQTKDPEVSFNYAGGGSSGDFDSAFDASEFKLVVPYDFYLQDMLIACSQGESMAMTGVDAATGKPICIKQAEEADKCPDGRMPKSLKVVLDADGNRKIVLDCGVEAKEAECPANYFLQQIDTTT
ncbi:MAG: type II secretion system protein, partial [Proteobacteria bacterium]